MLEQPDRDLIRRAVADDPDLSVRDWQRVNQMLSELAAWEAEPTSMLTLRRRRDARTRLRQGVTPGHIFVTQRGLD